MKSRWRIAVSAICALAIAGAAVLWHVYRQGSSDRKLAEDARTCQLAAEKGDIEAQYRLGSMYYRGQGVQQDYAQAIYWYRKAADQGNEKAQYGLGYMYYFGQGVPQSYAEAVAWYRKAADQRDAKAEVNLALMYSHGQGVKRDYAEAVRWYRNAADQGDAMGEDGLGLMYFQGQGVQRDYSEAVRWFRRATDHGCAKAQYDLGFMFYHGYGVPQDSAEAYRLFRMAADQGDEAARRTLGPRSVHVSTWTKVSLSVLFLGSLLFLIDSMLPTKSLRDRQQLATTLLGIFGMTYVGLSVYGIAHQQNSAYADAFSSVKSVLAAISVTIALLWLRNRRKAGTKRMCSPIKSSRLPGGPRLKDD